MAEKISKEWNVKSKLLELPLLLLQDNDFFYGLEKGLTFSIAIFFISSSQKNLASFKKSLIKIQNTSLWLHKTPIKVITRAKGWLFDANLPQSFEITI